MDRDRLRADLVDYFGTAMFAGNVFAIGDVSAAESATDAELLAMARDAGFDLAEYDWPDAMTDDTNEGDDEW